MLHKKDCLVGTSAFLRYIAALISVPLIFACAIAPATGQFAPQTPGNAPAIASPTPDTPAPVFTVLAPVWVRTWDGEQVVAVTGGTFRGYCAGDWCYIIGTQNKLWRGCTDRADGRGCQDE